MFLLMVMYILKGENNMVNSSEVTLEFEFQFEHQNGKNRQFVSRVIA